MKQLAKACSRCMLNTTVEYAQVCYSVLVTILITNYMMLGSGGMVYTTETICCWSALVQYEFWGIHDLCNTLHIFIFCSCVPPRIFKSPATAFWLYIARLTPTLSYLHDFVCLICILLLCIIWFRWYMNVDCFCTIEFTYFNCLSVVSTSCLRP